ncbi:MAG TPA: hypothetical protein VFQ63_02215 [Patescibacteria group bacterium]|nr:hypothetical protein [Patescibacteria group bacterium]
MRDRIALQPEVYQTLQQSPIFWPSNPLQRLMPFHVPRTVERGPMDKTRIFVTGHMVDQNPKKDRLPDKKENILAVRDALWSELDEIYDRDKERGVELVFCSATAGTDLLAMEWAMMKRDEAQNRGTIANISLDINLPFAQEDFLPEAVEYASQTNYPWRAIYDEAKKRGFIHEPQWKNPFHKIKYGAKVAKESLNAVYQRLHLPDWQSFVDLNMHMTTMLRGGDFVIAVWDGKGGITPGGTHHGLMMSEPTVGKNNMYIINTGINNVGTQEDYEEYSARIIPSVVDTSMSQKYDKLHQAAIERWQHSSSLRRRI